MAFTEYTGDTAIIGALGTNPAERGLTTQQFKDKFDQFAEEFVAWFNATHIVENNAHLNDYATNAIKRDGSVAMAQNLAFANAKGLDVKAGNALSYLDFNFPEVTDQGVVFRLFRATNTTGTKTIEINAGNATAASHFRMVNGVITVLNGVSVTITAGSGSPEGVVTAPVGSLYLRTDGGATTTLYIKTSGTGNTGWTAK